MGTDIQEFFKNQTIFMTGGTGFLGKVVTEKLLRSTEVKCIYMLVRQKRGVSAEERISSLASDPLFGRLKKEQPNALKRLCPILGDCSLPILGLSEADRTRLVEEVNIVIHGAATVRFDEQLSTACKINVRATVDLIGLAEKMKSLKAFVHTSSAFANCTRRHIDEVYYVDSIGTTSEEVLEALEVLEPSAFEARFGDLCRRYPNTYTFTKSLGEEAAKRLCRTLPCCIYRPAIIVNTYEEPTPGWIDNFFGPFTLIHGILHGAVRICVGDRYANTHMVPVDFCANELLACAWYIGTCSAAKEGLTFGNEPPIFNFAPEERNKMTWDDCGRIGLDKIKTVPLAYTLWFPFFYMTRSLFIFKIMHFFWHVIPGYLIDFALILSGKKSKMSQMYSKMLNNIDHVRFFCSNEFTFSIENSKRLWRSLSEDDKRLFCFDIMNIDWVRFVQNSVIGLRVYLCKAKPEDIPRDLRILERLRMLHYFVISLFAIGVMALFRRLLYAVLL